MPELGLFGTVCSRHSTLEDATQAAALREAWLLGKARGVESLKYAKDEIRRELQAEFNLRECRHVRSQDELGRQLVVAKGYTYHVSKGVDVSIGDTVVLPSSEWYGQNEAVVTALVSDFVGATREIVRVVK